MLHLQYTLVSLDARVTYLWRPRSKTRGDCVFAYIKRPRFQASYCTVCVGMALWVIMGPISISNALDGGLLCFSMMAAISQRLQIWLFRTNLNAFAFWWHSTDLVCLKHAFICRRTSVEEHKLWFMSWARKPVLSQAPFHCFLKCLSWSSSTRRDHSVVMETVPGGEK